MAKVYTLAVDQDTRDILMALADHADPNGCGVRPSIAKIAWKIGDGQRNVRGEYKNHRTVQRRIKELLRCKALILVRKAESHRANEYRLDLSVFPPKEQFVAAGDTFHAENRGDNLSGDKVQNRGDKGVSPKPSLESSNNNNKATRNDFQDSCYKALEQLTGGMMGDGETLKKLYDAWQKFPDPRRHVEAIRQTTAARSRTANVYLKAFLTFNPDYVPPPPRTYPQRREQFQRPQQSAAEYRPPTEAEKQKHREQVAARNAALAAGVT